MLKTRILTACVLLAVLVPAAIYLPRMGWNILVTAIFGLAAWEWAGLAGFGQKGRVAYALALFLVLFCVLFAYTHTLAGIPPDFAFIILVGLSSLFWLAIVPLWLRFRWPLKGWVGLFIGLVVLLPAWRMVIVLSEDKWTLFYVLAIAWIADIAAYFSGRRFGKHKLAPQISPGKTWEGVAGATVGVFLYLLYFAVSSEQGLLMILVYAILAPLLTMVCVLGDLFESLLKRQAGVKDSSRLLPGHGGILDRIDSWLALLPILLPIFFLAAVLSRAYS